MQDIDGCIDLTAEETVFEIDKEDFLFFDEIISANEKHKLNNGFVVSALYTVGTVWKLRKFSLTHFWQKFREINGFTKEVTKELISRNIFSVREFLVFLHCETTLTKKIYSSIHMYKTLKRVKSISICNCTVWKMKTLLLTTSSSSTNYIQYSSTTYFFFSWNWWTVRFFILVKEIISRDFYIVVTRNTICKNVKFTATQKIW